MRLYILFGLFASAFAAHLGNIQPSPEIGHYEGSCGASCSLNGRLRESRDQMVYASSKQIGEFAGFEECGEGKVRHFDGSCVQPIIKRNYFHFTAPQQQFPPLTVPVIPQPKIDYNIVFVSTRETYGDRMPVVVPPPQQKTIIYVLNRNGIHGEQKVIEIPSVSHSPEVYYINYNEGDNPILSGGIDLRSALASATQNLGQFIEGTPIVPQQAIVDSSGMHGQNIGIGPITVNQFQPSLAGGFSLVDSRFDYDLRPGGEELEKPNLRPKEKDYE